MFGLCFRVRKADLHAWIFSRADFDRSRCGHHVQGQTTINVGSSSDFYNAIQTIDNNPNTSYLVNVTSNVTMTQQVLAIESNSTVTVAGNGFTINGEERTGRSSSKAATSHCRISRSLTPWPKVAREAMPKHRGAAAWGPERQYSSTAEDISRCKT